MIIKAMDTEFLKRITNLEKKREPIVTKALINKEPSWIEHENGTVTWKDRIYVPKDDDLRQDIIRAHHDTIMMGHPGRYKTQELILRDYWWPTIRKDVGRYVMGCETCQRVKPLRTKSH